MSSDTETETAGSPPEIVNTETTVTNNILPEKSKRKYEKTYKHFMDWKKTEQKTSMSEDVLLEYFVHLSQKFNPASLWTYYSMLKNTLIVKHKVDLARYSNLAAFLKRKGEGYKAKKSKTFSPEEINRFLNEAPDQVYLQSKVCLIFGIMGACSRQELYNLQFNDVQVFDTTVLVTIRNTQYKTDRTFMITGSHSDLCKKYIKLRPTDCSEPSFFLHYTTAGKCTRQRIGINKFGALGNTIAIFLNLPDPEKYTGLCFRRTSATLLAAGDISNLEDHGECRRLSSKVAKGYIYIQNKIKVSNQILNAIKNKEIRSINKPSTSSHDRKDPPSSTPQTGQLHTSYFNHGSESEQETQPGLSKALRMRTSLDANACIEQDLLNAGIEQCRFCGDYSKYCVAVSGSLPYLAANKTTLALNHTSVQLDFNNHSLPHTVCRNCDAKLRGIADFLTVVKAAQDTLINVAEEREVGIEFEVDKQVETETEPLKTEYDSPLEESDDEMEGSESEDDKEGIVDSLSVSETEFVKKSVGHKRKNDAVTAKPKKLKAKECDSELIIDIKEEVIERENGQGHSGVSDSDMRVVRPSEMEVANPLVFNMAGEETSEYTVFI